MRVVFRVFATLFALPHLVYGCISSPLILLGLAFKLAGQKGNPLDLSVHPYLRQTSEGEIWSGLLVGIIVASAGTLYGVLLLIAPWTTWETSRRIRLLIWLLAAVCGIASVGFWVWVVVTGVESERGEFILFGGPVVVLYLACNVAVAIGFSGRATAPEGELGR
jgi:hypothetical protein